MAKRDNATPSDAGDAVQDAAQAPEHSEGGMSTRMDATDLGVPMLAGSPREPQGPEDAFGPGPKRGDYSTRIGGSDYHPHQVEPIPADEREPDGPNVRVVAQRPRAMEQGEVEGEKGGVTTEATDTGRSR